MNYENLERMAKDPATPPVLQKRIWILLAASQGYGSRTIARLIGMSRKSASIWRERIDRKGAACIFNDNPGGRPRRFPEPWVEALRDILAAPGAPSLRALAKSMNIQPSVLSRALRRPPPK